MSHSSTIRKMNGVEHALPYSPYDTISDSHDIYRCIRGEVEQADAGDFPKNIQEHFWIAPGDSWLSCGILDNGNYFFFTCEEQGMSLWVSSSWQSIVDHAMSRADYELYEQQTKVPPMIGAGEEAWPTLTEEEFWAAHPRASVTGIPTECEECHDGVATMDYMSQQLCADCFWDVRDNDSRISADRIWNAERRIQ